MSAYICCWRFYIVASPSLLFPHPWLHYTNSEISSSFLIGILMYHSLSLEVAFDHSFLAPTFLCLAILVSSIHSRRLWLVGWVVYSKSCTTWWIQISCPCLVPGNRGCGATRHTWPSWHRQSCWLLLIKITWLRLSAFGQPCFHWDNTECGYLHVNEKHQYSVWRYSLQYYGSWSSSD